MRQGRAAPHAVLVREVQPREREALLVAALGDDHAPRIDDRARGRSCARDGPCAPTLRRRHHVDLVLDRARPQQHVPVILPGLEREGRRDGDHARALRRMRAVQLGEAQVVTDAEAEAAPGRRRHHDVAARLDGVRLPEAFAARHVHVEQVHLAVDRRDHPLRIEQHGLCC